MKKQKRFMFIILFIIIIILLIYFIFFTKTAIKRQLFNETADYRVEKLIFNSQDREIYSLLFLPKSQTKNNEFPIVIVLPGAGGTKESRSFYADIFSEIGYAALILDQRGMGETNGQVNSMQQDFNEFVEGRKDKITSFLMTQDVLNALDALEEVNEIDKKKISVLGESMGGRFAIISAALDKRIKAAVIISSSGYKIQARSKIEQEFFNFINPNAYISKISPRPLLMLHAENDNVISIQDAKYTYSLASEPRNFIIINSSSCVHGYCSEMKQTIQEFLIKI